MSNPNPVTSPTLPTDSGIVHSAKEFSDNLTLDLTDEEITQAFQIITSISKRWRNKFILKFNDMSVYRTAHHAAEEAAKMVDEFEKELHNTLAEKLDLIATVDMTEVFNGGPPIVELVGHLDTHYSAKYGFDHERKQANVKLAAQRGEAFLGEKEVLNPETRRQKTIKAAKKD